MLGEGEAGSYWSTGVRLVTLDKRILEISFTTWYLWLAILDYTLKRVPRGDLMLTVLITINSF